MAGRGEPPCSRSQSRRQHRQSGIDLQGEHHLYICLHPLVWEFSLVHCHPVKSSNQHEHLPPLSNKVSHPSNLSCITAQCLALTINITPSTTAGTITTTNINLKAHTLAEASPANINKRTKPPRTPIPILGALRTRTTPTYRLAPTLHTTIMAKPTHKVPKQTVVFWAPPLVGQQVPSAATRSTTVFWEPLAAPSLVP